MTNLHCDAKPCAYNQDGLCNRAGIQVSGSHAQDSCETCCASFRNASHDATNRTCHCHAEEPTQISCDACHCTYNDDGKCDASGIQVSGVTASGKDDTACTTFRQNGY